MQILALSAEGSRYEPQKLCKKWQICTFCRAIYIGLSAFACIADWLFNVIFQTCICCQLLTSLLSFLMFLLMGAYVVIVWVHSLVIPSSSKCWRSRSSYLCSLWTSVSVSQINIEQICFRHYPHIFKAGAKWCLQTGVKMRRGYHCNWKRRIQLMKLAMYSNASSSSSHNSI